MTSFRRRVRPLRPLRLLADAKRLALGADCSVCAQVCAQAAEDPYFTPPHGLWHAAGAEDAALSEYRDCAVSIDTGEFDFVSD